MTDPEASACTPHSLDGGQFNHKADLPFDLHVEDVRAAMQEFIDLLGYVNEAMGQHGYPRLESMLMPANFSSIVGEFMCAGIPKFCKTLAKNRYHNGHPDLVPAGMFPGNSVQHASLGIEVKASKYKSAWQGHNVEDCWLMVFMYDSNRPVDVGKGIAPMSFRFVQVCGAQLTKAHWKFAGRSETSRRTITASVTPEGSAKMLANWIYRAAPANSGSDG